MVTDDLMNPNQPEPTRVKTRANDNRRHDWRAFAADFIGLACVLLIFAMAYALA